eukprot:1566885-Pyramimonas_sp.AAC.1
MATSVVISIYRWLDRLTLRLVHTQFDGEPRRSIVISRVGPPMRAIVESVVRSIARSIISGID